AARWSGAARRWSASSSAAASPRARSTRSARSMRSSAGRSWTERCPPRWNGSIRSRRSRPRWPTPSAASAAARSSCGRALPSDRRGSRGPLAAYGIATVPALSGRADLVEDAAARRREVGHLDDRAWMPLLGEVHEPPAGAIALLADGVAVGEGAFVARVVILGPARPVLQPLAPGGQEIPPHAGCRAPLLDQLELDIAGVGEGDGQMDTVVSHAPIAECGHGEPVRVVPGPDAAHVHPVAHRRLDVADHESHLAQRSEQNTHVDLLGRSARAWRF